MYTMFLQLYLIVLKLAKGPWLAMKFARQACTTLQNPVVRRGLIENPSVFKVDVKKALCYPLKKMI